MKQINSTQFESEVLAAKEPVLVDFFTENCPPCRALAPILQEWELESKNGVKVVKVDAAADQELAASYSVAAVPALFLFQNGKCIAQTVGLKSKRNLNQWVEEALRSPIAR
jgi:thioredoxin 1